MPTGLYGHYSPSYHNAIVSAQFGWRTDYLIAIQGSNMNEVSPDVCITCNPSRNNLVIITKIECKAVKQYITERYSFAYFIIILYHT